MWKLTPIYISVNGRVADRLDLKKVSHLDLNPGQNLLSYNQIKTVGARDGISLNFIEGQTRYLYLKAKFNPDRSGFHIDNYDLKTAELSAFEAEEYLENPPKN